MPESLLVLSSYDRCHSSCDKVVGATCKFTFGRNMHVCYWLFTIYSVVLEQPKDLS